MRLEGKSVLLTGATGLIGRELAEALAKEGARLTLTAVNEAKARRLAEELTARHGVNARGVSLDLADSAAVAGFAGTMTGAGVDIIIHCARSVEHLGTEEGVPPWTNWVREYEIDVVGPYQLTMALKDSLAKCGAGSVIFISSIYGLAAVDPTIYPDPSWVAPPHYGVAKAAQLHLTRELAVRLAPSIRVNAVAFGGVGGRLDDAFTKNYAAGCPSGRMLTPADLAEPVLFLASAGASGVTGHTLVVDGGRTIW